MKFPIRFLFGLLSVCAAVQPAIAQQQPILAVRITDLEVSTGPGIVTAIQVLTGGTGFTVAPSVSITEGGGTGATAESTILAGGVTSIVITNPGTGYTSAPKITLLGGGGSGATAVARVGFPSERFPNPNEAFGPSGKFVVITALATGTFPASGFTYTFFVNGTPIGTSINNIGSPSTPGRVAWTPPAPGAYFFSVTASDGTSPLVTSLPVRFFATGAVITSPQNPTLVPAGSSVVIQGDATTAQGFVRQIEFFVDGVSQGVDTSAPYSVIYTPPSTPGAHFITAVATDNNDVTVQTDDAVVITTVKAIGSLPLVAIASPTNAGALRIPDYSVAPNAAIPINVIANDSDGTITKVETYIDGVLKATDLQFPYSYNWQPQTIGNYRIVALAFDDKNNVVATSPVNVIISAPPTVNITQPSDNATLPAGAPASVNANASDSDGSVISVQFFADNVLIGDDTTSPYSVTWTPLATSEGKIVELTALATDNFGITRLSPITNIKVTGSGAGTGSNIGNPPSVFITSPAANARVLVGQSTTIAAQANDTDGNIQAVQFFANGVSIGSDISFPYSVVWRPISLGNYAIQAKALDDKGNVTTNEMTLTVVANSSGAPQVTLLSPLTGTRGTVGSPITIAASAVDSDGTIESVDFSVNGQVIGSATSFPYVTNWQPTQPGTYTILASTTDDGGNRVFGTASTITVQARIGSAPIAAIYFNNPGLNAVAAANAEPSLTPVRVSYNSKLLIGAVAVDEGGSIANVGFYLNGRLIGNVTAAPYYTVTTLDTLQDAIVTAVVTDNSGNVAYTTPIVIKTVPTAGAPLQVTLASPLNGGTYGVGSQIVFSASHNAGNLPPPSIDFYVDGQILQTVTTEPFTYTVGLSQAGVRDIHAVLRAGTNTTVSTPARITVVAGTAPTVSITSPTAGSEVNVGSSLAIRATAADSDGLVTSVQFFANGATIGSADTQAPYTVNFTPNSEGLYRFTALAIDSSGQSTVSSQVTVIATGGSTSGSSSASAIYSGNYFAGAEVGKISIIFTGGQSAVAIAHSLSGTPKVYFYQNIGVDASNGFKLNDASGATVTSGRFSDTGATGSFDNGRATFIAPAVFAASSTAVASGLYSGNLTGKLSSSVVGILGADGSLTVHLSDGTAQDAGTGPLGSGGAFSFALSSGGRIAGTISPASRFLTATVTGGPLAGSVTAAAATGARFSDGTLRNLSTRGAVGAGDKAFIAGFVVGGSAPKRVLIRAIGPSLAQFGVSGVIANPELGLFRGSAQVERNDNWGGSAAIAAASTQVGAFALNATSLDSVILATLAPGGYTAVVTGVAGATGVALVEVYDVDNVDPFTPQKVLNLSTRGDVGTGDRILIAGFVINGSSPKKVLVRAVGPALAAFGVTGTLADPVLRIVQGTTAVRENDNWGTGNSTSLVAEASTKSGAFALPAGSKDAAILLTLAPGTYSAQVSGVNNTTGTALVEVYEVP